LGEASYIPQAIFLLEEDGQEHFPKPIVDSKEKGEKNYAK
jgi:hypothetical protein